MSENKVLTNQEVFKEYFLSPFIVLIMLVLATVIFLSLSDNYSFLITFLVLKVVVLVNILLRFLWISKMRKAVMEYKNKKKG